MIKKDLNPTKKHWTFSDFLEIFVFVLSSLHLTFLLLSLFDIWRPTFMTRESFSYIVAFILLAVCLILYLTLMLIEKIGKFNIPTWLKCVFYIGFYIFTNIYYTIGLYENFWTLLVLYIYLSFVINIVALSLFFNLQKSDNGIIKTNSGFVSVFTFTATVSTISLIEIIITSINVLTKSTANLATLFVSHISVAVLISIVMSLVFYFSLSKNKKIINKCLIR